MISFPDDVRTSPSVQCLWMPLTHFDLIKYSKCKDIHHKDQIILICWKGHMGPIRVPFSIILMYLWSRYCFVQNCCHLPSFQQDPVEAGLTAPIVELPWKYIESRGLALIVRDCLPCPHWFISNEAYTIIMVPDDLGVISKPLMSS